MSNRELLDMAVVYYRRTRDLLDRDVLMAVCNTQAVSDSATRTFRYIPGTHPRDSISSSYNAVDSRELAPTVCRASSPCSRKPRREDGSDRWGEQWDRIGGGKAFRENETRKVDLSL